MGGALQKLMDARVDARFAGNYQRLTDKDLPQIWARQSSEICLQYLGRIGGAGVWQHTWLDLKFTQASASRPSKAT